MKTDSKKNLCRTGCWLLGFAVWTAAVSFIDVQAIGPRGSAVGFAALNGFFHELIGVHMWLYVITDWLGLIPLCVGLGFAGVGLAQLIKRRSFLRVDADILLLGGFYLLVLAAYILFDFWVINYRPILIDGYLEASYPSSTTLLATCVMLTAIMQFKQRIGCARRKKFAVWASGVFAVFMVAGRMLSGVHWLSDIVGAVLLSVGLVMLYYTAVQACPRGAAGAKRRTE